MHQDLVRLGNSYSLIREVIYKINKKGDGFRILKYQNGGKYRVFLSFGSHSLCNVRRPAKGVCCKLKVL